MKCPNCSFAVADEEDLKLNRFKTLMEIHKNKEWWERQPYEVLDHLKTSQNVTKIVTILDVGCGDGRWVPAILNAWDNIKYFGFDLYNENIEDCKKKWPELEFHNDNFLTHKFNPGQIDLILFAGTFNPKMSEIVQTQMLDEAQRLLPRYIVITFDYKCSGHVPRYFIKEPYYLLGKYAVSRENQDNKQAVFVDLYGK